MVAVVGSLWLLWPATVAALSLPFASRVPPPRCELSAAPSDAALSSATKDQFAWTKQWYPVAATEFLDATRPHAFTLLGRDVVLWNDGPSDAKGAKTPIVAAVTLAGCMDFLRTNEFVTRTKNAPYRKVFARGLRRCVLRHWKHDPSVHQRCGNLQKNCATLASFASGSSTCVERRPSAFVSCNFEQNRWRYKKPRDAQVRGSERERREHAKKVLRFARFGPDVRYQRGTP